MAASSDSFKKSHVQNFVPTSRFQQKQSKSYSNLLCKSLIIILVLVLIPLFPSQAPDFINQSILSKFWELLHLLFIGIAVSYGLFCRKSVNIEVENQSRDDTTSHAYLSGVLNVPSFFEDGFEKLCISDEKMNMQNWDSLHMHGKSLGKQSPPIDEGKKFRSLTVENGIDNMHDVDEEKVSQIWNSQYFQGESLMVVANGNFAPDEHKPLGLPVRSLRSRIADTDKPEFISRSGSNTSLSGSCSSIAKGKFEKFRGPIPLNLEKKFEEVAGPPRISLQSRSERMEMREEISNFGLSRHYRSRSGRDFELENFKSRSFRHPISSGTSSVSPELSNPKAENFESKEDFQDSLDTFSQSTVASTNVGVSFDHKTRGYSIGSSRELDVQRTSKNYFNDSKISAMQDSLDRGKERSEFMISNAKPSKLAKVLARGRSVRTIRSRVFAFDEAKRNQNYCNQTDEKVGGTHDQFEAPALMKRVKGGETEDSLVHTQKENPKSVQYVPKATFPEYQNNEKQNLSDSALVSEKDSESESEPEALEERSDENEAGSNQVEDAELEGSEVDRKADEFIAKFRQQMRLQKIASIKRYSCQA